MNVLSFSRPPNILRVLPWDFSVDHVGDLQFQLKISTWLKVKAFAVEKISGQGQVKRKGKPKIASCREPGKLTCTR